MAVGKGPLCRVVVRRAGAVVGRGRVQAGLRLRVLADGRSEEPLELVHRRVVVVLLLVYAGRGGAVVVVVAVVCRVRRVVRPGRVRRVVSTQRYSQKRSPLGLAAAVIVTIVIVTVGTTRRVVAVQRQVLFRKQIWHLL